MSTRPEPAVPGAGAFRVLVCHRRQDGLSAADLTAHFDGSRRSLVTELQADLGHEGYAQFRQLDRGIFVYRAIRFSRGPLVAGLLTAVRRRRFPRFGRSGPAEKPFDVIEELRYPSREALILHLTSDAGVAAMRRLIDDQGRWTRQFQMVTAELVPVTSDPSTAGTRVGVMFCLRAPTDLGRLAMLDYWAQSHRRLIDELAPVLGFVAYDQLHVRTDPALAAAVEGFGSTGEDYDGVALISYADLKVLQKGLFSLRTQWANLKLVSDEVTFIDMARSLLMLGTRDPQG